MDEFLTYEHVMTIATAWGLSDMLTAQAILTVDLDAAHTISDVEDQLLSSGLLVGSKKFHNQGSKQ